MTPYQHACNVIVEAAKAAESAPRLWYIAVSSGKICAVYGSEIRDKFLEFCKKWEAANNSGIAKILISVNHLSQNPSVGMSIRSTSEYTAIMDESIYIKSIEFID